MKPLTALLFYPDQPGFVAIWRDGPRPLFNKIVLDPSQFTGPQLLKITQDLLKQTQTTKGELTHIGLMTGPASYSHLRVFVATANTLAWAYHLPLFQIPANATLPDDLAHLLVTARVDTPLEPVYPQTIG